MTACSDCRFMQPSRLGAAWATCGHPAAQVIAMSRVDGAMSHYTNLCAVMRDSSHACGPDAELFQSKDNSDD